MFKRLPQIDIIFDHFEPKATIKLSGSCFRNAKMRHNLGATLFGEKHAALQPCFSAALITLPEHGVQMIRGTAECLIGPQPNDASVSHLEVCAEEITASIFWYAHACHHGLSPVSAILFSLWQGNNHADNLRFPRIHRKDKPPRRRLCRRVLLYAPHIRGACCYASLSFRALIRQLLMWRGH